jgi:predicted regulator of amino acid metabolism with ACT domain
LEALAEPVLLLISLAQESFMRAVAVVAQMLARLVVAVVAVLEAAVQVLVEAVVMVLMEEQIPAEEVVELRAMPQVPVLAEQVASVS